MRYDADLAVVIEPLVAGSSNIKRPKKILYKIIPKEAAGLKVRQIYIMEVSEQARESLWKTTQNMT